MKLKAITLALFVAGIASSYALADNGGGKGKKEAAAATTTAATTTSSTNKGKGKAKQADKKVTVCHKAGKSGKFVKISVAKPALKAHLKHGDVLPVNGTCPSAPPTTTAATTTAATTTAVTTTSSTTTTTSSTQ
jgi:hypothetical protein